MGSEIDNLKLSNSLSAIKKRIEGLRTRCASDPGNAEEFLSDALDQLQDTFKDLSAANEKLVRQDKELIAAQEALRASEECCHAFIAHSSEGIWRLESEQPLSISIPEDDQVEFILEHACIAECNDSCARIYGLTKAEELVGMRMIDILPRSDQQNIEVIRAFIRSGYRLVDKEIYERDKEGNVHCIITGVTGIVENNCLMRAWGVQRDVTGLRRTEEALRQSEEKSSLLIKYAPSMIYELDFHGQKFKSVNDEMCKTLGYTREELLAMNPFDLLEGASKNVFKDRIGRTLDSEPIKDFVEYKVKTKDGRELYGAIRVTFIFKDGQPESALVVAHDVTERKLMEKKLARKVLERTVELSKAKQELEAANEELRLDLVKHEKLEARLVEAKDAAEAAARAKSDFLANMSHEIRTPMNAVIGMTSLLIEDETLTPEQKDFIETIRMSGDAMMVIINDILDFSKMQEDKVVLEVQPFDLRSCIEESLDLVASKATEKGLNLAYIFQENVPKMIIGDPNRLRQILVNLLGNAVKFTERGEVELLVSSQELDGNYEVHFAVLDTGIGLTADQMDHLFQPFCQVEASITRKYGGTGLGLAIAKKLTELMNGKIWVESEIGKGSTFHFIIKAEMSSLREEEPLASVQPKLIGKQVLIVDDNKTNRHILGAYTYSWGMVPVIASNSKDVLEWMRRGEVFDIAILEMNMQDMDGLTLARKVREYSTSLPLVMLVPMGETLGSDLFEDYLTKPIKPSQLLSILLKIVSRKTVHPPAMEREVAERAMNGPMRILLAEDNVSSQKATLQMLKRLGYRADVVANGIEALQALERQYYDIVLMDVRMPEMDGLDATRIIRERWHNEPKVIAITAYALKGDREKCLAAGMDDYISKPVKIVELAEVLGKYQHL